MFGILEYIDKILVEFVMTIPLNSSWVLQKIYQQLFMKGIAKAVIIIENFKLKFIFLCEE